MANPRIQQFADSVYVKALQNVVTIVLIPFCAWYANWFVTRFDKLEQVVIATASQAQTFELRVALLERAGLDRQAAIEMLRRDALRHEYDIKRLEEATGVQRRFELGKRP